MGRRADCSTWRALAIEAETLALYSTAMLLDELAHTLGYAKLAPRIRTFGVSVDSLVDHYSALVSLVMPASVPCWH